MGFPRCPTSFLVGLLGLASAAHGDRLRLRSGIPPPEFFSTVTFWVTLSGEGGGEGTSDPGWVGPGPTPSPESHKKVSSVPPLWRVVTAGGRGESCHRVRGRPKLSRPEVVRGPLRRIIYSWIIFGHFVIQGKYTNHHAIPCQMPSPTVEESSGLFRFFWKPLDASETLKHTRVI